MSGGDLRGVYAKLDRADEHLDLLGVELRRYMSEDPKAVVGHVDVDDQANVIFNARLNAIPHRLLCIAGDAVQNLRSSLDHLTWRLVEAKPGHPGRGTQFPIRLTQKTDKNTGRVVPLTIEGGVSKAALDIIEHAQPYNAPPWVQSEGDHPLAVLKFLSNRDKHQILVSGQQDLGDFLIAYDGGTSPRGRYIATVGDVGDDYVTIRWLSANHVDDADVHGESLYYIFLQHADRPDALAPMMQILRTVAKFVRDQVVAPLAPLA